MTALAGRQLAPLGIGEKPTAPDESRRRRVLLAEDDPALRCMLAESIERAGFEVEELDSGTALGARIKQVLLGRPDAVPFDAVVSDMRMPGASGMSMLRVLRMFDAMTPFVLITAYGDRGTHREGHVLGATAVLDKPLDATAIVRELRRGFYARGARAAWPRLRAMEADCTTHNNERKQD